MVAFVALLEMLLQSFICNCNIDLSENFFLASKVSLFVPDFQAGAAVASGQPSLCLIRRLGARAGFSLRSCSCTESSGFSPNPT